VNRRYFGTDGIRGLVGDHPMTPEFVLKLGWAAGRALSAERQGLVLIGKDTRLSGYVFESALQAGLASAGMDVRLLGPVPTPAVAYLTRTQSAVAGVVISASHNPYYDNGIKFFSGSGKKLSDEMEANIEAYLDQPIEMVSPAALGKVSRIADAAGRYAEFCKSTYQEQVNLAGLRVVVDSAHGAGYSIAPKVFSELGAEVFSIGSAPDGLNINQEVGATSPEGLAKEVIARRADIGIALDGDGDRLVMADHEGVVVDGDELLYIMAADQVRRGHNVKGVVGTLMSNLGLEQAIREMGLEFHRANVGDRYVLRELEERGWSLGGEGSGHLICLDKTPTGDAIVAALAVISAMTGTGQQLSVLKQAFKKYPQHMVNVRCDDKIHIEHSSVKQAVAAVESELGDQGRVLLRPSGTEPLIRVMVEGIHRDLVEKSAQTIAESISRIVH
jgi:phosphoglucosamine mutase